MDGTYIASVVTESADAVYDYLQSMRYVTDPPIGMAVTKVARATVSEGYAVLHLDSPLSDTSGIRLMVDGRMLSEEESEFTRYDEISRTIVSRPDADVLSRMEDPSVCIQIVSDMSFLILAVKDFFQRYGDLIEIPRMPPSVSSPVFPPDSDPSANQVDAVGCVLSNRLSYIWGAPGTGKTQYVLATCIRACLDAGHRVAVFSPTNNSVEQVLRGIIKTFSRERGIIDGIIRIGVPTKEFFRDHPEMCEDRQAQRRLDSCMNDLSNLSEVMYERCCDGLEGELMELRSDIRAIREDADGRVMLKGHDDLEDRLSGFIGLFEAHPATSELVPDLYRTDLRTAFDRILDAMYARERPASLIEEFDDWSDADIMAEMISAESEADGLRSRTTGDRLENARIIASTPQQFISRFRPRGSKEDPRMVLDVDHVFLDEACYSGLVQALSLFSCGVPVTFLGDHMQLPPVSQIDGDTIRSAAERGGRLRYAYLWDMSAIYCEDMICRGPGDLRMRYLDSEQPDFSITARADLTESHRFGSNLAAILDRYVYRNGMTGVSDSGNLEMICIDAKCDAREGRENTAEVRAIRDFLKQDGTAPGSVSILTPYSAQVRLLKSRLGKAYRDRVMTVHGSQGREFDTVILSVADNGIESRDVPYRFTSSKTEIGLKVINTAVSRAKRRLVIVCDREFWMQRDDELIGGLLREIPEEKVLGFNHRVSVRRRSA